MSAISIKRSSHGLGMFANQRFSREQLILSESCLAHSSANDSVCRHCFKELQKGESLLCECGTIYCSSSCRTKDQADHGGECVVLKYYLKSRNIATCKIAIRLLSNRKVTRLTPFMRHEVLPNEMDEYFQVILGLCANIHLEMLYGFDMNECFENIRKIPYLRFEALSDSMESCGEFIADKISACNHSCSPNAEVIFASPNDIRLFALKDIGIGEEITICYGSPTQTRTQRRLFVKEAYNFECDCERCTVNQFEYPKYLDESTLGNPKIMSQISLLTLSSLLETLAMKTTDKVKACSYAERAFKLAEKLFGPYHLQTKLSYALFISLQDGSLYNIVRH